MSKTLFKLYRSLKHKEAREEYHLFAAETPKVIEDLLKNQINPYALFILKNNISHWKSLVDSDNIIVPVTQKELQSISHLKTPHEICGIFHIPHSPIFQQQEVTPILDDISDPANLGVIIRTCHWYGIHHLLATTNTVDKYNLKTVMSSKGSIAQVHVHYLSPDEILQFLTPNTRIFKADIHGTSIFNMSFSFPLAFIIGNEAHGIFHFPQIKESITIPSFSPQPPNSLNAAVSTAILIHTLYIYKKT